MIADDPGTKEPVLESAVSVITLALIDPVNNTPPRVKASGVPDNGIYWVASANVIWMV